MNTRTQVLLWTAQRISAAVLAVCVVVHVPIGLRSVLAETFNWRGRALEVTVLSIALATAIWGLRAVWAVFI